MKICCMRTKNTRTKIMIDFFYKMPEKFTGISMENESVYYFIANDFRIDYGNQLLNMDEDFVKLCLNTKMNVYINGEQQNISEQIKCLTGSNLSDYIKNDYSYLRVSILHTLSVYTNLEVVESNNRFIIFRFFNKSKLFEKFIQFHYVEVYCNVEVAFGFYYNGLYLLNSKDLDDSNLYVVDKKRGLVKVESFNTVIPENKLKEIVVRNNLRNKNIELNDKEIEEIIQEFVVSDK